MKSFQKGNSIPELLITVVLGFLITSGAFYAFQSYNRYTVQHQDINAMQLELKTAVKELSFYLHQAGYGLDPSVAFTILKPDTLGVQINDPTSGYCTAGEIAEIKLYSASFNNLTREVSCDGILKSGKTKHLPFVGAVSFQFLDENGNGTVVPANIRWVELELESVRYRKMYPDTLSREMAMRLAPRNLLL